MNFGKALRIARESQGMSIADLSEKLSVNIEFFEKHPLFPEGSLLTPEDFANALGIPTTILLFLGVEESDDLHISPELQSSLNRIVQRLLPNANDVSAQIRVTAGNGLALESTPRKPSHLYLANQYINDYDQRINQDGAPREITARQLYEDRAYHQAMMHAALAQAEALTEMAAMLRGYLATYHDPAVFTKE